jgi:hypothetical protein
VGTILSPKTVEFAADINKLVVLAAVLGGTVA